MLFREKIRSYAVFAACAVLVAIPWINPFASGPSPAVIPWLTTLTTAVLVLLVFSFSCAARRLDSAAFAQLWGKVFVTAWLFAGLISSSIGVLQYFGLAAAYDPWINQARYGEAFGNLRQRNLFATLTSIALAALVWMVSRMGNSETQNQTFRDASLALSAAGVLAVGNAVSSSRTGLFELALLCVLFSIWGYWRHVLVRKLLGWTLVVYAAAAFGMPYLAKLDMASHSALARLASDEACGSRLILWSNVLHLIAQKPWLGWGWGELDYAHFMTLYSGPRFCDILDNAHNLPLHLAVELGVPFAVLVCGGFAWWALRQKPWAERDATRQMAWAVIAVILLHSMLEYPLWYGPFQMAFGICVWLLWGQNPPAKAENGSKQMSDRPSTLILRAQLALILIACVLLPFLTYVAWDYRRISQIYLEPESRLVAYRTDTLNKIRGSWLFANQVRFAELLTTPLTPANAAWTFNTAGDVLHYSPEPRLIEKLIESAVSLGKDDDALAYLARYRVAFPKEHALWSKSNPMPIAKPN